MKIRRWSWVSASVLVGVGGVVALDAGCGEDSSVSPGPNPDSGAFDVGSSSNTDAAATADTGSDSAPVDSGADSAVEDSGSDAGTVFASCKAALAADAGAPSGVYTIDPDGAGPQGPITVYCDMTSDGGGWTLGLLRNSVDDGSYPTFASGYQNTAALAVDPKVASAKTAGTQALAGWIDLNTFAYTELVLEGFSDGTSTFRSEIIAKSTLRIPFGQSGYYLYDDANGYYWCGGAASYTDNGVGQVEAPAGAPADCKGHTSIGNGWDFGGAGSNTNLTACGGGSNLMKAGPAQSFVYYPNPGGAHAFWVR